MSAVQKEIRCKIVPRTVKAQIILTVFALSRYHSAIMSDHLPDHIDPLAFVDKRKRLKGSFALARMSGLADLLMDASGEARVELQFDRQDRYPVVMLTVSADLVLQCQCCLEPLPWPVNSRTTLAVVKSIDEANLLPESLEPLLMEEETIGLADLVEQELVLAVPPIPQHEQCDTPAKGAGAATGGGRENPFARLAELKKLN
ncbi:MAG: metal-binding protein [Proteobacteria bacterium]|nr:metal-binding protein [Pseudomonadota bacterium]